MNKRSFLLGFGFCLVVAIVTALSSSLFTPEPVLKIPYLSNLLSPESTKSAQQTDSAKTIQPLKIIKDVGEPHLDHFGLTAADFEIIKTAGFDAIEGNFDLCASDEDVSFYLDQAAAHNLQVILPAGAGEAEWGYECDEEISKTQKPAWQSKEVIRWVSQWKNHPALYAWDISNEAGGNFPNGNSDEFKLTLIQLQEAYRDVKKADPGHPLMIRMNGWYFYDFDEDFFRLGNPFGPGVADIVMVNTYSNVDEYFDDFVETVTSRAQKTIQKLSPETKIVVALGVWEEPPLWQLPTLNQLENDLSQINPNEVITGVAFFKYGAAGSEWFLPDLQKTNPDLWETIANYRP